MKTCLVGLLFVQSMISVIAQKNWQHISPDHDFFYYQGRFDTKYPKEIRYDWPGTTIHFQFTGDQLQLVMQGGDRNYFNLFIDDELQKVLHLPSDTTYTVEGIKGKGPHVVRLQKRTEGEMGMAIFKGIKIGVKEQMLPNPPMPARKIEFIGNSITCGYGTEGTSREEDFLPSTENVDKSYAFIVSRALNAECVVVAHSGLGVVRNYGDQKKISDKRPTMIKRYRRTLDEDSLVNWDFSKWQPDAVVINLGTNDYWGEPYPDQIFFQRRYEQFIQEIRQVYRTIPVFCICGPLRDEPAYSIIKEVVTSSRLIHNDHNLYFIGIPTYLLNNEKDLGSDWHPSYRGQLKMAVHIIPTLANVLKWDYDDSELRSIKNFK